MSWGLFLRAPPSCLLSPGAQPSWFHPKIRYSSSRGPAVGPRNELPSTTLLIPAERTSGRASGLCWRTKKYGCTRNKFLLQKQRGCCQQGGLGPRSEPKRAASSRLCFFPFSLTRDCSMEAVGFGLGLEEDQIVLLLLSRVYLIVSLQKLFNLTTFWIVCKVYFKACMY